MSNILVTYCDISQFLKSKVMFKSNVNQTFYALKVGLVYIVYLVWNAEEDMLKVHAA